jgi:hypothetical protein
MFLKFQVTQVLGSDTHCLECFPMLEQNENIFFKANRKKKKKKSQLNMVHIL